MPYGAAWLHLLDGNDAMAWVKSRDLPCGLIFIAAGAFGLLFASDLPVGSGARMGPGYFPTLLSWTLIGVGGIVLLRMILGGRVPAAPMQWRPILLVTVGLGSTVAAITSSVPFLVVLAKHKAWFFAVSGGLMLLAGWSVYRKGNVCPAEPQLAALCELMRRWNKRVFWIGTTVWGIGFFAAYLLLPIRIWLDV